MQSSMPVATWAMPSDASGHLRVGFQVWRLRPCEFLKNRLQISLGRWWLSVPRTCPYRGLPAFKPGSKVGQNKPLKLLNETVLVQSKLKGCWKRERSACSEFMLCFSEYLLHKLFQDINPLPQQNNKIESSDACCELFLASAISIQGGVGHRRDPWHWAVGPPRRRWGVDVGSSTLDKI